METIRATFPDDTEAAREVWKGVTITETLTELFDNARRAGASAIEVEMDHSKGNTSITVRDDGQAVKDLGVMLAYGKSGWTEEEAMQGPLSGCGLYALSAYRSSRIAVMHPVAEGRHLTREVNLTPKHFAGKAAATIEADNRESGQQGTEVTFDAGDLSRHAVRQAVATAAAYMPIPVRWDGTEMKRKIFLDDAVESIVVGGFRFGIYANDDRTKANVNIHGRTVHGETRTARVQDTVWSVRADAVGDIGGLKLQVESRQWLRTDNDTMNFRTRAERVLLEGLGRINATTHAPTALHNQARGVGITLPPNQPWLKPWNPRAGERRNGIARPEAVPHNALLVAFQSDNPDRDIAVLRHAASLDSRTPPLFAPDKAYEHQEWYENRPRIVSITTLVTRGGDRVDVSKEAATETARQDQLVERVELQLNTVDGAGNAGSTTIDARYATTTREDEYGLEEATIYVARDAGASIEELTQLLVSAYFASDKEPFAHQEEQERRFRAVGEYRAVRLLASRKQADQTQIARTIENEVLYRIVRQPDENEEIVIRINGRKVDVTFETIS